MTEISFNVGSSETYANFQRHGEHGYISIINKYLQESKCDSTINKARFYDGHAVISFNKASTFYNLCNTKLDRMRAIANLIEEHYDLVDFEEEEFDIVLDFEENKNA